MKRVIRQVGGDGDQHEASPDFSLYVSTHPWKILSPSLPGHVFRKSHWWLENCDGLALVPNWLTFWTPLPSLSISILYSIYLVADK